MAPDPTASNEAQPGRVLLPPYLPRIPTRDRIENALRERGDPLADEGLVSFILIANLAGEVEACNCSSSARLGGILATAALIERLSRSYDNLLVLDAGGNRERRDGALKADELPAAFIELLERLVAMDFSANQRPSNPSEVQTQPGLTATAMLGAIGVTEDQLPSRGRSIMIGSAIQKALAAGRVRDVTREVQVDFLSRSLDAEYRARLPDLLADGFVLDQLPVPGDLWRDDAWLVEYRERTLREWVEWILADRLHVRMGDGTSVTADDAEAGSECRPCHENEWQAWRRRDPHGHAWETLSRAPNDAHKNAFCVPCHTTGLIASDIVRDPGQQPRVLRRQRDVSCRSCHMEVGDVSNSCTQSFGTVPQVCMSCHRGGRGSPDLAILGCRNP